LLLVRPEIGSAKVTRHVTALALVFAPTGVWRTIEATVVSGRSTGVQVAVPIAGAAVHAGSAFGAGSVVVRLLKLLPETVLWFKIRVVPAGKGSFTVTWNLIVTVLPAGRVPIGTFTVSPDSAGAAGGANSGANSPALRSAASLATGTARLAG